MAQQTVVTDDIDGSPAVHQGVELEFDGQKVKLDLSEENHAELQRLQGALQSFLEAGTPVAQKPKRRKDSAQIREWAQTQDNLREQLGSGKGRLPAAIVEAYDAAHASQN